MDEFGQCQKLFQEVGQKLGWFQYRPQDLLVNLATRIRQDQVRASSEDAQDEDGASPGLAEPPPSQTRRTTVSRVRHQLDALSVAEQTSPPCLAPHSQPGAGAPPVNGTSPAKLGDRPAKKKTTNRPAHTEKPFSFFPSPGTASVGDEHPGRGQDCPSSPPATVPDAIKAIPSPEAGRDRVHASPVLPDRGSLRSTADATKCTATGNSSAHSFPDAEEGVSSPASTAGASPAVSQPVVKWSRIQMIDDSDIGIDQCADALDQVRLSSPSLSSVTALSPRPPDTLLVSSSDSSPASTRPRHRTVKQLASDSDSETEPVAIADRAGEVAARRHCIASDSDDAAEVLTSTPVPGTLPTPVDPDAPVLTSTPIPNTPPRSADQDIAEEIASPSIPNTPPPTTDQDAAADDGLASTSTPKTVSEGDALPTDAAEELGTTPMSDSSPPPADPAEDGNDEVLRQQEQPVLEVAGKDSPAGEPALSETHLSSASAGSDHSSSVSAHHSPSVCVSDQPQPCCTANESADSHTPDDVWYSACLSASAVSLADDLGVAPRVEDFVDLESGEVNAREASGDVTEQSDPSHGADAFGDVDEAESGEGDAEGAESNPGVEGDGESRVASDVELKSGSEAEDDDCSLSRSDASLLHEPYVLDSPRIDVLHQDGSLSFILPASTTASTTSNHHRSRLADMASPLLVDSFAGLAASTEDNAASPRLPGVRAADVCDDADDSYTPVRPLAATAGDVSAQSFTAVPSAGWRGSPTPESTRTGSKSRRSVLLVSDGSEEETGIPATRTDDVATRSSSSDGDDFERFLMSSKTPKRQQEAVHYDDSGDFIDDDDYIVLSDGEDHYVVDNDLKTASTTRPRPDWHGGWATPSRQPAAGGGSRENDLPDTWDLPTASKPRAPLPRHGLVTPLKTPNRLPTSTPLSAATPGFKRSRLSLVRKYFQLFNSTVFSSKLPSDFQVTWNKRLLTTSGYCVMNRTPSGGFVARIELSNKVCDCEERLRDTLLHEMCHAAVWMIDNIKDDHHGPAFKAWARRASKSHPDLPLVSRCHSYSIAKKFTYKCTGCGMVVGRHSKSINLQTKVCAYCHSPFELLLNDNAKPVKGFALFVQENFKRVRESMSSTCSHADVMVQLGHMYRQRGKSELDQCTDLLEAALVC